MTSQGGQSDRATSPDGGRAASSRPGSGRLLTVQVHMLDESVSTFHVQYKATGRVLFDQVCRVINLLEVDYFGLEYTDSSGTKYWLDYDKPLCRQMGLSMVSPVMCFAVKFYTPDPAQLEEEFTRYLFSLQIKKDLSQGILQCSDSTAALLASYIVQASCGDFVAEDYPDHSYLSSYKFVPHQDAELEIKIMENHKKHISQSPAEADLNLLETARRCELYGIRMTPAKDNEGLVLNLSVAHMGIIVFQNFTKINTFSWTKIRKLSFKRKKFLIKLHPEGYGYYKETADYFFESRNECKNFWKKCIENHSFFRCTEVKKIPRQKTRLFSRGSSFRYSGRTQKQIVEYVRENYVKRQPFQRSTSLRLPSRSNVETPAVPSLLPVSSSRSCGSVAMSFEVPESKPSAPPMQQTAVSEPNSPRRESARHPPEGPLTPSQDTDDNISHDSYHLEEGDSSAAPHTEPGSPITIELHAPPPPPPCLHTEQSHESSPEVHNGGLPAGHSMSIETPQSPDLSYFFHQDASGKAGMDNSSIPASPLQESCSDVRRKKYPNEKAYFITKELVMTERTYKKHLEVILLYFKEKVEEEDSDNVPAEALATLFSTLDPIYQASVSLLRDLEQRLAAWEGKLAPGSYCNILGIGGLLLDYSHITELYDQYLEKLPRVLEDLQGSCHHNSYFEQLYREFERQKECYLPLALFLLQPAHRLLHYSHLLQRLHESYESNHADNAACLDILQKLKRSTSLHEESLGKLENFVMLMELQRDVIGVDNLMLPGRSFIREGCLQKLSRKGYQQRMFFLFSDMLIYASRASTPQLQFKVHGQLPLHSLSVDETEPKAEAAFRFNIYAANRALMVAASSEEERQKWMKALSSSIAAACNSKNEGLHYSSLKSCHSSDERLDRLSSEGQQSPSGAAERHVQHRSNTAVHVCWHRNTSVGWDDHKKAHRNYLSGFLLRKFKNSSGWQKLWVVFTNFCLFFYKSYHESSPLASLPLVGYMVTLPGPNDNINKDFVFKLQFKTHVYFFRAESEYAFERWVEVISVAAVKKM